LHGEALMPAWAIKVTVPEYRADEELARAFELEE
jgi:hypothetical protein